MLACIRIAVAAILWLALAAGTAAAQAHFDQGWAGFTMRNLEAQEAAALGWAAPHGTKVLEVYSGSPAQAAGVMAGDIVVSFGSQKIENFKHLIDAIRETMAGTGIQLVVLRKGREIALNLKLGSRPGQYMPPKLPAGAPLPMLDTGGHMAKVSTILFTPDGTQLVSASDDKTIRVWDLATGKTLRILRGESEPGPPGKVYAIVLSPGGKWLAAAGDFGAGSPENRIRLYDFASGKLAAVLSGHEDIVNALAFSPDGRLLLSGSGDGTAFVWDTAERKILSRLKHGVPITVARFTPDSARYHRFSERAIAALACGRW